MKSYQKNWQEFLTERRISQPSQIEIENHAAKMANKYSVPFELIMRHMWIESAYKVNALSSAGAFGLMQLMPDTARRLGFGRTYKTSWKDNIEGGAKYLGKLSRKYTSDGYKWAWMLTSLAYFTGPGSRGVGGIIRRAKRRNMDPIDYLIDRKNNPSSDPVNRQWYGYIDAVYNDAHYRQSRRPEFVSPNAVGGLSLNIHPALQGVSSEPKKTKLKTSARRILVIGDSNTYPQKAVLRRIYGNNPNIKVKVMANKSATSKNILDAITNKSSKLSRAIDNFNPTNIIIGSLGGNDWRYGWPGNEALLEKYVQSSVIPLMQIIKDNNGSWTGLPPAGPKAAREYKGSVEPFQPIRKKINDAYKKAAADVGLPYRDLMATGIFNPTGNKYHAKSSEYQKYYKQNPIDKNLSQDDSSKSSIESKSKSERKLKLDKEKISLKNLKNKIKRYVKIEEESQLEIANNFWSNQKDFRNSLFTGRGAKTWFINFDDPYKEVNNYINQEICEYSDPCPKTIDKVENIINQKIRSGVVNSPTVKYWTASKIQELSNNPSQYPQKYVQWFKLGLCTTKTKEALKLIQNERRIIKKPQKIKGVQPLGGSGIPNILDLLPYISPED